MARANLDDRRREVTLNSSEVEAWVARCTRRLMALEPDSPLDGTDFDDIAGDLLEAVLRDDGLRSGGLIRGQPWLFPEFAAETHVSTR